MKKKGPHKQAGIIRHIDAFLIALKKLRYSRKSLDSYKCHLTQFNGFLLSIHITRIQDVALEHLNAYRQYLTDLKLSNAAIYGYLLSVRTFFNRLEENQHIFLNPAQTFIIPKLKRRLGHVPSEKDIKTMLSLPNTGTAIGVRNRAILETLYTCGLRLEEITGLTIFDPDIKQTTMRIMGKGKKERVVPLGKHAAYWLKNYLETARSKLCKEPDKQALWISRTSGKKLTSFSIDKLIRKYAKEAGIKKQMSAHTLRRACATHMLLNGAHPVQIQILLGHSTLSSLTQYLKVTITDMKKMHKRSKPGK